MSSLVDKLYQLMDKGPLRVLALLMTGCVMWDPTRFAARTSALDVWQGPLLVWAVCTVVIYGVGFRRQRLLWRVIFSHFPAFVILITGLIYVFR
ncbi:cyd operon protein YbgE [Candidatus Symbiopectobacterium sp.]|uniref:cyd operon protein YbgE n=1 Tax=Candidatus Symbiopectobacterium sp. TaxID=2816440 RepID=UPI0025BF5787|nr:cyd operon protein YbgE [Candidatus Symbiopectobacterium sp.]